MSAVYYIDACIWRDYLENRTSRFVSFGEFALMLFNKVIKEEIIIVFSDVVENELKTAIDEDDIIELIEIFPKQLIKRINASAKQVREAIYIAEKFHVPRGDALHAVLARDSQAILVTRDRHFSELQHIVVSAKPEELL